MVEVVGLAGRNQAVIVSMRVDKMLGTRRQVVLTKVSRLSSLTSVSRPDPDLLASNPCQLGQHCSHFCSWTPAAGLSCGCPPGLSLMSNNVTCGHPPTCQPTEFTCGSVAPLELVPSVSPSSGGVTVCERGVSVLR